MRTIAFFSYARRDDKAVNGLLSKIRGRLETEVQAYSGEEDLEVFQDTDGVKPGDQWEQRIRDAIDDSAFFLPVMTPFYFKRPQCRKELEIWLACAPLLGSNTFDNSSSSLIIALVLLT